MNQLISTIKNSTSKSYKRIDIEESTKKCSKQILILQNKVHFILKFIIQKSQIFNLLSMYIFYYQQRIFNYYLWSLQVLSAQ